ncbi:MAG: DNA polymerase I [Anaerolineaceae bacterium]
MPPTIYLIDGHALAYRMYFALTNAGNRFQTHAGEPTAGTFGFANVLMRILENERPEYLAVAFDTGKTFRNDLYSEYKATRAKMPEDLRPQIERIRQLVDAFGLPRLEQEGMEGDDVLGSIAQQAVAKGLGVKIITGDKDLLQLVNDRIIVNLPGSDKLSDAKDYLESDVVAKLGVRPNQVVDYKALVGDHSDNIPGVHGIGEKTAVSLLKEYPTLDDIYAHLEQIPGRARTLLEAGKESAYLSQNLARIRTDVAVTLDLEKARTVHIDTKAVEALFQTLEFRTLIPRLRALNPHSESGVGEQLDLFGQQVRRIGQSGPYELKTTIVQTEEQLKALKSKLEHAGEIAFDTETTSTDSMRAKLVGISLAVEAGEGFYIPVGHNTGETQLTLDVVLKALTPAMTDPHKPKVGHNLKYDYMMLARQGLRTAPLEFDTMIAEWLIDPDSHNLGLKDMADAYLGISMTHIEELIGTGKNQIIMADVPVAKAAPYAAADAEVSLRLTETLRPKLTERHVERVFNDIEMPLISVLAEMEMTGITLDGDFLKQLSVELKARLHELEKQVYDAVGHSFNLNSTQQLSDVLFIKLGLQPPDPRKKTASGHYSTSAEVLEELQGQNPVVDMLLEYRELSKLQSTYVETLPLEINPETGRIHTSFNQTGSVTGRLASSNPNLQNIPVRTELGRQVRRAFVASPGWVLLSIDYSQIELRLVAQMSGDKAMLDAFRAGQDIHATTAAAVLNIPIDQVTKDQRRHAKAINFGLIYGMSAFGLTRTTDLTLAEAENFVRGYFQQFPGVKKYLDGIRRLAASQGYVETLLGRRRYFPNLKSGSNKNIVAREEREAINAPIQGTAADIMKLAMIRVPAALQKAKLPSHLLLQVHDELVLECPPGDLKQTAAVVQQVMENAYPLDIPLTTEARSGKNWEELQPFKP